MTPRSEQPTDVFVKNILKIPDNMQEQMYDTLSETQRLGLCIAHLSSNGCSLHAGLCRRVNSLVGFKRWCIGFTAGILGMAALIAFILTVLVPFLRHQP